MTSPIENQPNSLPIIDAAVAAQAIEHQRFSDIGAAGLADLTDYSATTAPGETPFEVQTAIEEPLRAAIAERLEALLANGSGFHVRKIFRPIFGRNKIGPEVYEGVLGILNSDPRIEFASGGMYRLSGTVEKIPPKNRQFPETSAEVEPVQLVVPKPAPVLEAAAPTQDPAETDVRMSTADVLNLIAEAYLEIDDLPVDAIRAKDLLRQIRRSGTILSSKESQFFYSIADRVTMQRRQNPDQESGPPSTMLTSERTVHVPADDFEAMMKSWRNVTRDDEQPRYKRTNGRRRVHYHRGTDMGNFPGIPTEV